MSVLLCGKSCFRSCEVVQIFGMTHGEQKNSNMRLLMVVLVVVDRKLTGISKVYFRNYLS